MKKQTQKKLIYLRYILPPCLMLLILAVMLIPSYKYVAGGEIRNTFSAFGLLDSFFSAAREVVFATAEQETPNLIFSQFVFWMIIVSSLLWIAAFVASVYSMIVAIKYFTCADVESVERSRTLFITLFPNRVVLSAVQALIIPLALFPYLLSPLYGNILGVNVSVVLCAPDALMVSVLCLVAIFTLSAVCVRFEKRFDADVFKKSKTDEDEEVEAGYEIGLTADSEDELNRAEKNERIRRLLQNKDNDNE